MIRFGRVIDIEFQSHIGAIRIPRFEPFHRFTRLFQSHIGAIRIEDAILCILDAHLFQSHIGAIRIATETKPKCRIALNFNPTLVQLEFTLDF